MTKPKISDLEHIEKVQTSTSARVGEVDAVFGNLDESGPNYRNVGWIGTSVLMMKTQIGLGVLSIPAAFDTLGIIPGVICLCLISAITTWSDYMVGAFKLNHLQIYGIDEAVGLILGRIAKHIFATVFCLYWIFVAGSGMLGMSIGLNAVSSHSTCTAVFVAIAAILGFGFSSIQTLGRITWIAWIGLTCILTSILTVTIAVGIQDKPSAAPPGLWVSNYKLVGNPTFTEAITAISSMIFAFSGTPAFFSIASEMRDPQLFTRAVLICQSVVTATYIAIGCVVYYFCGSYVASPALGSAGPLMKRICYGFALPGLLVTTLLMIHIPAKFIFIRLFKGSKHLTANTPTHWIGWLGCTGCVTVIAYIIASSIPVFNSLVSLIGALLGTLMCLQPMGCMWLYDNWISKKDRTFRWYCMAAFSVFVIVAGTFCMIAGTYGSVVGIIGTYKASGGSAAWSCADNSNSV